MNSLLASFLSAIFLIGFATPALAPSAQAPPWQPGLRSDPPAKECRAYHWRLVKQVRQAQPEVLFLGDSITGNWVDYGLPAWNKYLLPLGSFDIGIAGEITQSILWRLERGAVDGINPKVVVLMIGINNVSGADSAIDTVHGIETIVATLRKKLPTAKILLLAILPRDSKFTTPLIQQKIIEANKLLSEFKDEKVYFLNLGPLAVQRNSSDFFIDGLHPSLAGYQRLGPSLAKAIAKLKAPKPLISHQIAH